jgi:hypothetical protein
MFMRIYSTLLGVLLVGAAWPTLSAADLTGKVVLQGTPKPERTIDMAADPRCGALHDKPVTTRHYVVGADGGLANVLVFVKSGLADKNFPMPTEVPVLDQVGCEYMPFVMGVRVNQKFKIKNSDPTMHNVHATPKAGTGNKEFNMAQPVKDMVTEKSFDAPEVVVRFKCDVHDWMFAYVGVFDHPFFAVTGKDGSFKIPGLPKGRYVVEAYHVKTHGQNPGVTQEVTVDGNAQANFTIELK